MKNIILLIVLCFASYLMISLIDYKTSDPNLFQLTFPNNIQNITGKTGAILADLFFFIFGKVAYCIPFFIMFFFWEFFLFFNNFNFFILSFRVLGIFIILLSSCGFISLNINNINNYETGGIVGIIVSDIMFIWYGYWFSFFILLLVWLFGIILCIDFSWLIIIKRIVYLINKNLLNIYINNYNVNISGDYYSFFLEKKQLILIYFKKNKIELNSYFFFVFKDKKYFKLRYFVNKNMYYVTQINNSKNLYKSFIYSNIRYKSFYISYNVSFIKVSFVVTVSTFHLLYVRNFFYKKKYLVNIHYHFLKTRINYWGVSNYEIKKFSYNLLIIMHNKKQNRNAFHTIFSSNNLNNIKEHDVYNKTIVKNNNIEKLNLDCQVIVNKNIFNSFNNDYFCSLNNMSLSGKSLHFHKNDINVSNLNQIAKLIENKLLTYNIKANVVNILPGPVITKFELNLFPGIKSSRLVNISRDLARSLSVSMLRIIEVIPGKPYVGLEIPNNERQLIDFYELLICKEFCCSKSLLTLILGKDTEGKPFVIDLAKMPHLLIAGTTGSGKSMGINSMILSILCKSTPEEVRLILIDPKVLELSIYKGIPHLLTEVITDVQNVHNTLLWCIKEMNYRYQLMSLLGVRDLITYNEHITNSCLHKNSIINPLYNSSDDCIQSCKKKLDILPYIIIIIDEFADLMMLARKKTEDLIVQLSQKSRAAGIHLIIATQRPSVNIITGVIKANIPSRISFVVASKVDSRIIIDQNGAEKLLGKGDMLYLSANSPNLIRIHGAYVQNKLINFIIKHCKHFNATI